MVWTENTLMSLRKQSNSISELDLSLSELDDKSLSKIFSMSNSQYSWPYLSTLTLSNCRLTDKISNCLLTTPAVHLSLGGNWLTDGLLTSLC